MYGPEWMGCLERRHCAFEVGVEDEIGPGMLFRGKCRRALGCMKNCWKGKKRGW